MRNDKNRNDRLGYLNEEREKQEELKKSHLQEIEVLKRFLFENEKEIKYNQGWIDFHEKSIERHEKEIQEIVDFNEKQDQEKKLQFHIGQIESHHKKYTDYHKKEMGFLKKQLQLSEKGVKKCEEQLAFLNEKIKENQQ